MWTFQTAIKLVNILHLKWHHLIMRLLIVLSVETTNIAIFSYFSIFKYTFLIARFSTTRSNPITIDTAFIQITAGAATIVDRRPTPVIPNQIAVTPKQLSMTPIILNSLLHFVLVHFVYLSPRLIFLVFHQFCYHNIYMSVMTINFIPFHFYWK